MTTPTLAQLRVLRHVADFLPFHHRSPTIREISAAFGWGRFGARDHVRALLRKGLLETVQTTDTGIRSHGCLRPTREGRLYLGGITGHIDEGVRCRKCNTLTFDDTAKCAGCRLEKVA